MDGDIFERAFVKEVFRVAEEKYGTLNRYALVVWPDREKRSAVQTAYNLKNPVSRTGKPQSVRLSDAVRMVEVLGIDFPSFCWRIAQGLQQPASPPCASGGSEEDEECEATKEAKQTAYQKASSA